MNLSDDDCERLTAALTEEDELRYHRWMMLRDDLPWLLNDWPPPSPDAPEYKLSPRWHQP